MTCLDAINIGSHGWLRTQAVTSVGYRDASASCNCVVAEEQPQGLISAGVLPLPGH